MKKNREFNNVAKASLILKAIVMDCKCEEPVYVSKNGTEVYIFNTVKGYNEVQLLIDDIGDISGAIIYSYDYEYSPEDFTYDPYRSMVVRTDGLIHTSHGKVGWAV